MNNIEVLLVGTLCVITIISLGGLIFKSANNKVITSSGQRTYTIHVFEESEHNFFLSLNKELQSVCKTYDIIDIKYSSNDKGFSAVIIMK